MELRHIKEQKFHNKLFKDETREQVSQFYSISKISLNLYRNLLQRYSKNRTALDFGCGPEGDFLNLGSRARRVFGIDISTVAISKALQRSRQEKLEHIFFSVMNCEELAFEDTKFDLIYGKAILHHLDLKKTFSELARSLKPEGKAIFFEPLGHNPIINLYRRLTPQIRSEDEQPLLLKDLKLSEKWFGEVETHFFFLSSLLAIPFRRVPFSETLLNALDSVDRAVFKKLPQLKRYAWTVVIELSRPKKVRP